MVSTVDDAIHSLCLGNPFYCPNHDLVMVSRSEDGADPLDHDMREAGRRESLVSSSFVRGIHADPIDSFEGSDQTVPSLLLCDFWNS